MPAKMIRQTSFITGEVNTINWKRTDSESYLTACQSLLNMQVTTEGYAVKRPGTLFLNNVTDKVTETTAQYFQMSDKSNNYYLIIATNLEFHLYQIASGTITFLQTLVTPYLSADLSSIDSDLNQDVLVLTHNVYPPARVYVSVYNDPLPPTFAYQVLPIYPYPSVDFGNIDYSQFTINASVAGSTLTFQFTGLASDPGYTTAWIGGIITGLGTSETSPSGYAIITNVVPFAAGIVTFTGTVQVAFAPNPSLPVIGNQYRVLQPGWSTALGWPRKVTFYQNRLWMAGSDGLESTTAGSKINNFNNFDVGIARDSDAIVYNIGQSNPGPILWMNGGNQLEIYSLNFEFAAPTPQGGFLSPSTFALPRQSSFGASDSCKPISYLNDSYYINKTGNAIINYQYDGIGQTYTSTNVSIQASHLVKSPVNRALLQGSDSSQDTFIYYLNSDNTITIFQFSHQYKLAALSKYTVPNDVLILDIISINNQIYLLKEYTKTSQFIVEIMDSSVKLDCVSVQSMSTTGLITGLSNWNGYEIDTVFSSQDYGLQTVSGGEITVDNPLENTGNVQVGFIYPVELTPMYIFAAPLESNYQKFITRIYVDYDQSLDFYVNGDLVPYQYFDQVQLGLPPIPVTDTFEAFPLMGYERFQTFSIIQNSPYDLKITGIAYMVVSNII